MGLEAAELARWTRFAAKGGIGKCIALCDCVAESADDLMFLKDDEITVLYQIPDREGFYLGHCEGVVGRFNGADVQFLTKLKKPVMTKRSSVSATSVSGKSPTPTSGVKSPSPSHPPSRRSSSHADTADRRSSSSKARVLSPLSGQTPVHSASEDEGPRHPPHMSRSSVSTAPDSVLNTPAVGSFSPNVGALEVGKSGSYGTPSPRDAAFPIFESDEAGPSGTPPPPVVSVSSVSSPPQSPQQPRYTSLAPPPLSLFPDGNTSPLRITKRSPLSPQNFSFQSTKPPSPPPLSPRIPSADIPDSSYSTLEDQKRLSLGSDARVGIGLSLLQDLANEMDSDSDEERRGRWSRNSSRHSKDGDDTQVDEYAAALNRVGRRDSTNESQESTVEGLGYARSDEGEEEQQENTLDQLPAELQEFPQPPTSLLSSATSPVVATFDRERRPSLAPSATSATSTSSWEGASDIYDDYRYSRYSVMSKMSRFSGFVGSGANTPAAQTPPPVPESRPSMDSYVAPGRARTDSTNFSVRSRTDSSKSRPSGMDLLHSVAEDQQLKDGEATATTSRRRTTDKTMSVDSDASVYTQNSRFSNLSQQERGGSLNGLHNLSITHHPLLPPSMSTSTLTGAGLRPAPLNFTKQEPSPLLHTRWGSPVSSTDSPKSAMFTPILPVVESPVNESSMKSPTFGGFASAMRQKIEEDRVKSPGSDAEKEERGRDGSVVVEDEEDKDVLRSGVSHGEGLGDKIVVEDEEELPSRILNSTMTSSVLHESLENSDGEEEIGGMKNMEEVVLPTIEVPPSPLVPTHPPSTPPPDNSASAASNPSSPGSPSPSHLRPSLAELRLGGTVPLPGTNQRRSLFLPHPNAPKSPGLNVTQGPMYIAAQQQPSPPPSAGLQQPPPQVGPRQAQPFQQLHLPSSQNLPQQQPHPQRNVFGVIRMALTMPPPSNRPQGRMAIPANFYRGPTIYGRTEEDLANAVGPVPIIWSVEPPPPPPQCPPAATAMAGNLSVGGGVIGQRGMQMMSRQQQQQQQQKSLGQGPPPQQQQRAPPARSMSMGPAPRDGSGSSAGAVGGGEKGVDHGNGEGTAGSGGTTSDEQGGAAGTATAEAQKAPGGVIPRANFFPKSPGLRPRSRSFSGFNSTTAEVPLPVQKSGEDPRLSAGEIKRSLTASTSSPALNNLASNVKPLRPSPLSLSVTSGLKPNATSPALKTPSSPLAQSVTVPTQSSEPSSQQATTAASTASSPPSRPQNLQSPTSPTSSSSNLRLIPQLRSVGSRATLNEGSAPQPAPTRPGPASRSTLSLVNSRGSLDVHSTPPGFTNGTAPGRTTSLQAGPRPDVSSAFVQKVVDSDAISIRSSRSQLVSPPPSQQVARQPSLRSKLSLPNLRRKPKQDDETSLVLSPTSSNPHGFDIDLLQVQDMAFELVRPNLAHFQQAARTSEDSNVLGRENSFDVKPDSVNSNSNTFLRPESPSVSVSSGGRISGQRSPTIADSSSWGPQNTSSSSPPSRSTTDAESSSMDAHRQRELKWMSVMSSNPASQARKSKKVKKLLMDGVPSSVRYLVWSYLTDGKARSVPGVYAQLCGRGASKAKTMGVGGLGRAEDRAERIERDIKTCFKDQPHLQGHQGPVGVLLQAYLNMVPDVQYSMGLTLIVGQLLLLSPEEDAFWIFVSIMDTHIRSYFSASTTQMEVDAALFSRALENNDGVLARKLLVDMGIQPVSICQLWFSMLFVGTLPPDYLNRVWDLFLFEGIPFLLRVGLAVVICCRRQLLESTSEESVLHILLQPPQSWLPATPDAFLSLAFSVKLKDDDIKKQRIKMEAQVKRQTQAPRIASASGLISLPRT